MLSAFETRLMVVLPSEQKTGARSEESRYQQSRMIQRHDFIPICFEFSFFSSKNRLSPLLRRSMLSLHPLLTSCVFPGMMMSSPAPIAAPPLDLRRSAQVPRLSPSDSWHLCRSVLPTGGFSCTWPVLSSFSIGCSDDERGRQVRALVYVNRLCGLH